MRIGVDGRILDRKITGTSRYLLNLLSEIPNLDRKNEYFVYCNSIPNIDLDFFKLIKYPAPPIPFKLYSPIWINLILPEKLKKNKIDVLFSPNILVPLRKNRNIKKVSVVHDVIPKVFPEYYPFLYKFYLNVFLPLSLKKADLILTVSEYSKKDILKYFDVPNEKIKVVHNTVMDNFHPKKDFSKERNDNGELRLPSDYVLYVGAIEKRKNILAILQCMDILKKSNSKLELVLIGKPGYGYKEIETEILKRKTFVKHYTYIPDGKIESVYNNAKTFLFPSNYEGFGIPALEALKSGVPVISSNTSSLPEVVGDGGFLFKPDDHQGMAEKILELESNSELVDSVIEKGLRQAEKFNIRKITFDLIKIFDSLK